MMTTSVFSVFTVGVLAVAAALSLVGQRSAAAAEPSPQDDGQVIVVPNNTDQFGQYAPPRVDMHALQQHGQAPIQPGYSQQAPLDSGPDQSIGDVAGGTAQPQDGLPPGCFLGGFGVGGGPGGLRPGGSAVGLRCLPPTPADTDPPGALAAPPLPTPAELAARAFEQLRLPLPVPRHSPDVTLPDGRAATVVGENTWAWTDRAVWRPATERVQVGPVWAKVTATPIGMTFDSGLDGSTSCSGPGTPYDRSYGLHAASPDCGFVYTRSSYGQPNDQTTAEWAIQWSVSWVGSDGSTEVGGDLPQMQSRNSATFAVAEVQALRAN